MDDKLKELAKAFSSLKDNYELQGEELQELKKGQEEIKKALKNEKNLGVKTQKFETKKGFSPFWPFMFFVAFVIAIILAFVYTDVTKKSRTQSAHIEILESELSLKKTRIQELIQTITPPTPTITPSFTTSPTPTTTNTFPTPTITNTFPTSTPNPSDFITLEVVDEE